MIYSDKKIAVSIRVLLALLLGLFCAPSVFASSFHLSRKAAALKRWKKEMEESYPTKEVLMTTRYFVRDVAANNQQYIMTMEGEYWDIIRSRYGGKSANVDRPELQHLYDFNWYVFHELKKYREATVSNSDQFFRDYLGVVDEFCESVSSEYVVQYFFEAYYVDWLVTASYQRQNLARVLPVVREAIKDLPQNIQPIQSMLDTLTELLSDISKNRDAILDVLSVANGTFLKSEGLHLTGNFFVGRKDAVLVNAFRVLEDFRYPVKIAADTLDMAVLSLKCIDNLSHGIAVPGYYYKKQVFIFPDNQLHSWDDFVQYFEGKARFPLLDLFVCDTTIKSYLDNGMISQSAYREMMSLHSSLTSAQGRKFVEAVDKLAKPDKALGYPEWKAETRRSLLMHEVVGHGGTFVNGVTEASEAPTFKYHVDAEFYAYLLQFLYSNIRGFDLACMFSFMANPITFSHQNGNAYLRICRELAESITNNKVHKKAYGTFGKQKNYPNIENLRKNLDRFESLGYQERIDSSLLPLVGYLNTIDAAAQEKMFRTIYSRNTAMPIPEPAEVIAK